MPTGASELLVDSHRHWAVGNEVPESLQNAFVFGTGPKSDWDSIAALSRSADAATAAVGFGYHPWYLDEAFDLSANGHGWIDALREALLAHPRAFLGEIGLDKNKGSPWDTQVLAFERQLDLAAELGRPVSVHCVRAFGPMLTLLLKRPHTTMPPAFVFHGFTGSPDFVASLLKMPKKKGNRFFFGVAASTTGKLKDFDAVINAIPADRLLVESDCHDSNEASDSLRASVEMISKIRPSIAADATANAKKLLSVLAGATAA